MILLRAVPVEKSGVETVVLLVEEIGGREVETALTELMTLGRAHTELNFICQEPFKDS